MKQCGLQPDVIAYNALMSACAKGRQADKAFAMFSEMKQCGLQSDAIRVADNSPEVLQERKQSGWQTHMEVPCSALMKTSQEGKQIAGVSKGVGERQQSSQHISKRSQEEPVFSTQPCHSCLSVFVHKFKRTIFERQCPSSVEVPHALPVKQNSGLQVNAGTVRKMDQGDICSEGCCLDAKAMVGLPSEHQHQRLCLKLHRNISDAPLDHGTCAVNGEATPRWEGIPNSQVQDYMSSKRDNETAKRLSLQLHMPAEYLMEASSSFGGQQRDDAFSSRDRAHDKITSQSPDADHQEVAAPPGFEDCEPVACKVTGSKRRCPNKIPSDQASR
eukprot:TRINITY_DN9177_c1_g1_i3.p1 TRINITY_DN9177_c1_g1~~TRINITY_DN9177_c1_g1_i3.p1  ORF type:complete len:330 (+),score=49.09 TRINITY_DN9177_c1_g1_i3:1-990(+)